MTFGDISEQFGVKMEGNNFESDLKVLIEKRGVGFYSALIDLINIHCAKGDYAETLVGQMERAKIRLLIACEKESAKKHEADAAAKADGQVKAQEGMVAPPGMEKPGPRGINKK